MIRSEVFRIVWSVTKRPDGGHEQAYVDGFNMHSLWAAPPVQSVIDSILKGMPRDALERELFETKASVVAAPEYVDVIFDVRVWRWPDDRTWLSLLERCLRNIVEAGASVAWVAPEGSFSWPDVFAPGSNVFAAYSPKTGFMHAKARADAVRFLADDEVLRLEDAIVVRAH